ncbi:unnamed protein product [Phytomonas sp. Hart1]|nr:unnamed protein product [Phytomonas sp. Hart1]|eukprot:CCW71964.1 unnamed protein product [Phytomonas sp. isolate Hart1]
MLQKRNDLFANKEIGTTGLQFYYHYLRHSPIDLEKNSVFRQPHPNTSVLLYRVYLRSVLLHRKQRTQQGETTDEGLSLPIPRPLPYSQTNPIKPSRGVMHPIRDQTKIPKIFFKKGDHPRASPVNSSSRMNDVENLLGALKT